ncbi:hypothetical protein GGR32_001991 [Mesonia hippocampi]|uniref:Uncharacterized protein n=1 Tax=Mesonia hippocampi TaxID=1628250 RepID=A0A840ERK0_9FLAO|nr:hypothetical protein [Mesonia hippocampi]MBB4119685.1 hypothetical protein [Mesonia hippocampi]
MVFEILITIASTLSALSTYFISERLNQGAVRASALVTFVVSIIFLLLSKWISDPYYTQIPVVVFGASFVGMVSSKILQQYLSVAFSGVIFSIIYLNLSPYFSGVGGALGTTACIAVICTYGFLELRNILKNKQHKKF